MALTLRGDGAITGTLADYSNGLPAIPGMTVTPRSAGFIPAPFDSGTRPPFTVELRFAVAGPHATLHLKGHLVDRLRAEAGRADPLT